VETEVAAAPAANREAPALACRGTGRLHAVPAALVPGAGAAVLAPGEAPAALAPVAAGTAGLLLGA